MDRLACVDLPAFPLQILLRQFPEWSGYPAVVVADDKPTGLILWANEAARRAAVLPGQRYAHGLSLTSDLRAGVISSQQIDDAVSEIAERMRKFTPDVEPAPGQPGCLWLGGRGMRKLYRTVNHWIGAISKQIQAMRYTASVCAGFSRFGTYAIARACSAGGKPSITAFRTPADESQAAAGVPLDRLDIDPELRDTLARLGIYDLGQFLRLPPGGLLRRFGPDAFRLHELAAGRRWDPPQYEQVRDPPEARVILDDPEEDISGLVFAIKRGLDPLLANLAEHKCALGALAIDLHLYRSDPDHQIEVIKPAEPTLDARSLLRLVHLRLESTPPGAGVIEIFLTAASVPARAEQLALFSHKPNRDLRAADVALSRIRAEMGNHAVVKASLRDAHLPEAQFRWVPLERTVRPRARAVKVRANVRRLYRRPILLPPQNQQVRDDGWILRGLEFGAVTGLMGPYIVSGGWWRSEVHREYHYADTRRGECLWVFYDRARRRWFLQGQVE